MPELVKYVEKPVEIPRTPPKEFRMYLENDVYFTANVYCHAGKYALSNCYGLVRPKGSVYFSEKGEEVFRVKYAKKFAEFRVLLNDQLEELNKS